MKLRHLQKRTLGSAKKPRALETTPGSNRKASHSPNRPCQPYVLEKPSKGEPQSGPLVRHPPRLQPKNQARPRKAPCGRRYVIVPAKCRQRRRGQSKPDAASPGTLHPPDDRPTRGVAGDGMKHPESAKEACTTNEQVEVKVPSKTAGIHHHTRTQAMAHPKPNGGTT